MDSTNRNAVSSFESGGEFSAKVAACRDAVSSVQDAIVEWLGSDAAFRQLYKPVLPLTCFWSVFADVKSARGSEPFVIADYGAHDGRASLKLMQNLTRSHFDSVYINK